MEVSVLLQFVSEQHKTDGESKLKQAPSCTLTAFKGRIQKYQS